MVEFHLCTDTQVPSRPCCRYEYPISSTSRASAASFLCEYFQCKPTLSTFPQGRQLRDKSSGMQDASWRTKRQFLFKREAGAFERSRLFRTTRKICSTTEHKCYSTKCSTIPAKSLLQPKKETSLVQPKRSTKRRLWLWSRRSIRDL